MQFNLYGMKTGTDELPRTRGTDPETSHQAERYMRESGKLTQQQDNVLALVRRTPGWTAREYDTICMLDGAAHRRLVELERQGLVRRGEARPHKIGPALPVGVKSRKVKAATWYPVESKKAES